MPAADDFKAVMRHYPTGVTVVTSMKDGQPRGVTVNAFCSVSADPPTVLICINREARSYLYISTSKIFCVNVLAADQIDLAERFSGKLRERQFEDVAFSVDKTGAAVLAGTVAHLDCEVLEEHHVSSHSIFIGRVLSCSARVGVPLGYFNSGFHDFALRVQ
ncbi:MAG: flavin reductase family protein [Candidatus Eremiobacteraeota bacterium]|nr:flavin reductase family protein [Candidatus Eremiobacteraeota bacterium]